MSPRPRTDYSALTNEGLATSAGISRELDSRTSGRHEMLALAGALLATVVASGASATVRHAASTSLETLSAATSPTGLTSSPAVASTARTSTEPTRGVIKRGHTHNGLNS